MIKTVIFRLEVPLSFQKKFLKQTWKSFSTKFRHQWKGRKSSYKVKQILKTFYNLIALILSQNCLKGLRVTKIVQEIKFEEVSGELEAKACFHGLSFTKYSRLTLVSTWNSALRVKFNFCFTEFFASIYKIFILAGRLDIRLSFYEA